MYNLIINYIHNLGVSKTPQEIGHNSRPNKDSEVHTLDLNKQTMPTQKIAFTTLAVQYSRVTNTYACTANSSNCQKTQLFTLQFPISNLLPLRFQYSSTATFTELYIHICSVCHVAKQLCTESHKIWVAYCSKIQTICPFQDS